MKYILACAFLFLQICFAYGNSVTDSLLTALNTEIGRSQFYDAQKLQQINRLKKQLAASGENNLPIQFAITAALYDEYKIFNFDSAFVYAKNLEKIAGRLNDPSKVIAAKIKLSFILLSAGLFKETFDYLQNINVAGQPDSLKAEFYSLKGRSYYDLASYNSDNFYSSVYTQKGNNCIDSSLLFYSPHSFEYIFFEGLKYLQQNNIQKAEANYQVLIHIPGLTSHQTALVTSTLGSINQAKANVQQALNYQIMAAIADIKSSTKETFAIFNVAELLFQQGDFKSASVYIEKAIADASFYGARQRKVQVSSILPIIESKKINYIESQRKLWIIYAAVVTFILALLAFLIVTIYRQFARLKEAKRIITEAHSNLYEVNAKLQEANKIKEEYIGYFFNINSDFFQKIERFKKLMDQKMADRKIDDIRFLVNTINIKKEKEELLQSFDKVFLKLFPNFVEEFNALFKEEDQIRLKERELLNTDLRIFALIRMGITENEKIAQILEYSVNTIYAYKTKIKNRSTVPKEEFEKRVMEIKSV